MTFATHMRKVLNLWVRVNSSNVLWASERFRALLALSGWFVALGAVPMMSNHPLFLQSSYYRCACSAESDTSRTDNICSGIAQLRLIYQERTRNESSAWLYIFAVASLTLEGRVIDGTGHFDFSETWSRTLSVGRTLARKSRYSTWSAFGLVALTGAIRLAHAGAVG